MGFVLESIRAEGTGRVAVAGVAHSRNNSPPTHQQTCAQLNDPMTGGMSDGGSDSRRAPFEKASEFRVL